MFYRSDEMALLDNIGKPLGMAALALLGYRALQSGNNADTGGGLLSGLLGGGSQAATGGLLSRFLGGAQPTMSPNEMARTVPDGLNSLAQQFQNTGYGDTMNSWISNGANKPIAPNQLHQALGPENIEIVA
jgi:uncharacterized protein YidB (DUF937 family)